MDPISLQDNGETNLSESILEEIRTSAYTCLVCTDYLTPESQVWSCSNCYRVFDLDCIKDWSKRGSSTQDDHSWRCPSCNFNHNKIPKQYTCWCGKLINPNINYLEPHSCGNICSNPLPNCSHECTKSCHPGPHIEKCTSLGPILKCHCGKHSKQLPCTLTPYNNGWSCDEICNDLLSCGIHRCQKKCHSGICDDCDIIIDSKCYCGKSHDKIYCHDRLPKISSNEKEKWIGNFECLQPCDQYLDCGIHKCSLDCHSISKDIHKCPNDPKNLTNCPCGKHKINELLSSPRKSCLDPIPTCDNICNKRLPCGHKCYWKCHTGECALCYRSVDKDCHCGFTHYSIACKLNVEGYQPTCQTKCNAKFNCKRHFCTKKCCDYRQQAFDRSKLIKKQLRNNVITTAIADQVEFEDVHTCKQICNSLLSCGKHHCKDICHSGPCRPCLESSSDDLVCYCGKTIVSAPVRCGTQLPRCPYQCTRPTSCGHRPEHHNCHEDDIPCPKCTMLVTKTCHCEKKNLVANVMCYQEIVSCFKVCDKLLTCGRHKCKKTCHKPGECTKKCNEKCLKIKLCGHECEQLCHGDKPCNESLPCKAKVVLTCDCGRKKQPMLCFSVNEMVKQEKQRKLEDNEANEDSENNETKNQEDNVDEVTPTIPCDEVCIKEHRNKLLFEALGLNPARTKETEISIKMKRVQSIYTQFVLNLYSKQTVWCSSIEDILRKVLTSANDTNFRQMKNSQLKQGHNFRPMKPIQRRFVKELADAYGLFSESHDPEPNRSVFVKLLNTSSLPDMDLSEAYAVYKEFKEIEKKKATERSIKILDANNNTGYHDENSINDSKVQYNYYNGIIIKDVYFGITVETVDAALYNLWNLKDNETDEKVFPLIKKGKVEFINEGMYVFYGEDIIEELLDAENITDVKSQYETQIKSLSELFDVKVKEKNLALKCIPVKIDIPEGIILEIMKEEEVVILPNEEELNNLEDVIDDLKDLKIESTVVNPKSSEWW